MPTTTPLTFNTPISGSIGFAGQQEIYTFTGSAGQRLYYDALKSDLSDDIRIRLVDPNGETIFLDQDADTDYFPLFTLTTVGTYQLILESDFFGTLNTGSYNFQLLDVANAPNINLNQTIISTLSPGRETQLYRFIGTAGQSLGFDSFIGGQSLNSPWILFDPNNQFLDGTGIGSDLGSLLTVDGTYVLALLGSNDTDVNYGFQVVDFRIPNLQLNTHVSGVIEPFGRQIYTFNGSEGQRLYYRGGGGGYGDSPGIGPRVQVLEPDGEGIILDTSIGNNILLITLPETTIYTLLVTNNDSESEAFGYGFELLDAGTTPASFNTPINGTFSPGSEIIDLYGFTGTAGQRLIFDSLTPNLPSATWRLYADDPFIPIAFGGNLSSDFEVTLLPFDFSYVLVVEGSSDTNVNYSFQIIETAITVDGTSKRDTLVGNNTVEIFTGFQGADILTGGVGRDIFRYTSIVDGGDRITDFAVGSDQIDLSAVLANVNYTDFSPIYDGYVQFSSRGQQGSFVQIDPDGLTGSGQARNFIFVEGIDVASLSDSNNFIFSTL